MGEQHWLVVTTVDEPDAGPDPFGIAEFADYEILHPDCPLDEHGMYFCDVGFQESNGGVRFSLRYSGTPVTEPGRYPIIAWHTTYRGFDYLEHDGGLAVDYLAAAAALQEPHDG